MSLPLHQMSPESDVLWQVTASRTRLSFNRILLGCLFALQSQDEQCTARPQICLFSLWYTFGSFAVKCWHCVKLIVRRERQKWWEKRAKSQNSPEDWKCLKLWVPSCYLDCLDLFYFIWLIKKSWQKKPSDWATAFRLLEEFSNDKDWPNAFLNKSRKIICPEALFLSYCSNK